MNVSKQLATTAVEDGVSMYLSFDESMSSISYKSTATSTTIGVFDESEKEDSNLNKTLEPQKDNDYDTMKDALDSSETAIAFAPIRVQPLHVLHEFKALSSTPSKIDENHGNHHIMNKSGQKAFQNDKQKSNLSNVFENLITQLEKSLITDKALLEKSLITDQEQEKENKLVLSDNSMPSFSTTSILAIQKANNFVTIPNEISQPKTEKLIVSSIEKNKKKQAVKKKVKMHTVVRKSICEPNLQTNRPSRIEVKTKPRFSYMNNGEAINVGGTVWPSYRSNRYQSSDDAQPLGVVNEAVTESEETIDILGNKMLVKPFRTSFKPNKAAIIARNSVLPSSSSEMHFAPRRMSTIVKTTFNSTTRKVPGKSNAGAPNTAVAQRRSVLLLQNKLASPLLSRKKGSNVRSNSSSSSGNYIPTVRASGGGGGDVGKWSPRSRSANARRTMQIEKSDVRFSCSECGAFYNVKSLLDAHKRTHRATSPEALKMRSQGTGGSTLANNAIGTSTTNNHRCKYCDKGFAIARALHIHLLEHCPKIPAADRRKLNYKEMDHVIKAETPHFRMGSTRPHKKVAASSIHGSKDPLLNFPVKKNQEKNENGFELLNKNNKDNAKNDDENISPKDQTTQTQMAPPASSKIKKKTAHAGVYRTPNKEIPCISCKQSFKNIIDYTNHMMMTHQTLNSSNNSKTNIE